MQKSFDGNGEITDHHAASDVAQRGVTRRAMLRTGFLAAGALMAQRLFGQSAGGAPPGALVIRNARPLDAEASIVTLRDAVTATDAFFVRSHFGPPTDWPVAWQLVIDGEVETPLTLTLRDLHAAARVTRTVTLECAGNGRALFALPSSSGVQWERGAVSTATWTGVPLHTLLQRAGVKTSAQHLWMEGMDRAPLPNAPRFLRSIPRALADSDALVAYEMNGAPIPLLHGGPVRLIVPGWFGMASTKWLTHVHARTTESDNHFMARGYRYADGSAVTTIRTKSVITMPLSGDRLPAGRVTVRGQAWTSIESGGIRGVEVSADGGATWTPGTLLGDAHAGAWRGWEAAVTLAPGAATLLARATDNTGGVQPMQAAANAGGYGNNSIHQVPVHVG